MRRSAGEVGRCDADDDETYDGQDETFVSAPPAVVEGDLDVEGGRRKYLSKCIL